jgi:hypothetical protein
VSTVSQGFKVLHAASVETALVPAVQYPLSLIILGHLAAQQRRLEIPQWDRAAGQRESRARR